MKGLCLVSRGKKKKKHNFNLPSAELAQTGVMIKLLFHFSQRTGFNRTFQLSTFKDNLNIMSNFPFAKVRCKVLHICHLFHL